MTDNNLFQFFCAGYENDWLAESFMLGFPRFYQKEAVKVKESQSFGFDLMCTLSFECSCFEATLEINSECMALSLMHTCFCI